MRSKKVAEKLAQMGKAAQALATQTKTNKTTTTTTTTKEKKKEGEDATGEKKERKKVRFSNATQACRKIRNAQKASGESTAIRYQPMQRLVRRIAESFMSNTFLRRSTVEAFRYVVDDAITQIMRVAMEMRLVSITPGEMRKQHTVQVNERHVAMAFRQWLRYHPNGNYLESTLAHCPRIEALPAYLTRGNNGSSLSLSRSGG
jgi:histone H3/H4